MPAPPLASSSQTVEARGAAVGPSGTSLAGWLLLTVGGGALIGVLTSGGDSPWYVALDKPSWTPPSWVFAPVWTVLYALMGVATWLVGRHGGWRVQRAALTLFVAQLALNFAWSPLFFTAERPGLALVDIVILWVLVALTIRAFGRVGHGAAGWLLVPYLCWVSYATALNAWIVLAN